MGMQVCGLGGKGRRFLHSPPKPSHHRRGKADLAWYLPGLIFACVLSLPYIHCTYRDGHDAASAIAAQPVRGGRGGRSLADDSVSVHHRPGILAEP